MYRSAIKKMLCGKLENPITLRANSADRQSYHCAGRHHREANHDLKRVGISRAVRVITSRAERTPLLFQSTATQRETSTRSKWTAYSGGVPSNPASSSNGIRAE